jgi:predicted enzyme related to lactoylglutathione lyase
MTEINNHSSGTFCWVDLAATNAEQAKEFYAGLFGWHAQAIPVGSGVFTMLQLGGREVASLYQLSKQQQAQGVPAHWMAYVAVVSADDTAERVRPLGGQVLVEPFDVLDLGRMALILDPTGAPFALWQAERHIGVGLANQPGTLSWTELITDDPASAGRFYTHLFGWDLQVHDGNLTFSKQGRRIAGMRQIAEAGDDLWPQWRVTFAVADCEASIDHARALGGEAITPPTDIFPFGRAALIQDSQGAVFSITELMINDE